MDNLTHSLTGLMMARAGLGRTTERGGTLMMILAVNIPDSDVFVAGLPGGLSYFEYHRGYTHALIMTPVLAAVALLLARWFRGASVNWRSYLACWIGVLSHLAMDTTNVYGVRLLLPFSPKWVRLDTVNIIDPWILIVLLLAIAAPALAGLVSSEIGGRKAVGPRAAWAWFALVTILSYEGFRLAAHARAVAIMGAHLYGGLSPPKISAIPDTINPLRWRGVVQTEDFVLTISVHLTEEYEPNFGHVDYPTQRSAMIDAARTTEVFRVMERFDQLPFWKVFPMDDLIRVQLIDMRFGTPREPGFAVATALVNPDGRIREARLGP